MPNYLIYQLEREDKLFSDITDSANEDAIFVSDERLEKIPHETSIDLTLQNLMSTIQSGWPEDKTQGRLVIHEYWPYRDELVTQNGLVWAQDW